MLSIRHRNPLSMTNLKLSLKILYKDIVILGDGRNPCNREFLHVYQTCPLTCLKVSQKSYTSFSLSHFPILSCSESFNCILKICDWAWLEKDDDDYNPPTRTKSDIIKKNLSCTFFFFFGYY